MKVHRLFLENGSKIILEELQIADSFLPRLRGLMGKTINPSEGLLIRPCNSIHCFFMKMPIDVLFLDRMDQVIIKIENMKPWSISPIIKDAKSVIEATAGTFYEIQIGDRLILR